jgi:hypothetical protein
MREEGTIEEVLGRGIKFPNMFSKVTKKTNVIDGVDKINQSINDILSTRKGSRVLYPEYGSNLHRIVFEPNDEVTEDLINLYTVRALEEWEPRIDIQDVDIITPRKNSDLGPHDADIRIAYKITMSNIEEVYVYPLRREGRAIKGSLEE